MISYDENDRNSAALCATKEARGDGDAAMRAVLHVLANRVGHPGFAHTLHDVIFGKNQFSSMSIVTDTQFDWQPKAPKDLKAYTYCISIADAVLQGSMEDITKGAHYYDNPRTATSGWFKENIVDKPGEHPETARLGNQIFYA